MPGGYMGKLLFIDLTTGEVREETPGEMLYRDFIGGYGVGSRILYDRQKGGVDPLGPDNIFGYMTGPLTGTPAIGGTRYQIMAKSPLTLGWGDANSGGFFGPYLKFAGYDGIFVSGISDKPVYLAVINGKAELKDASHLWGRTTYETEDTLAEEYGKSARISCIGPAGEKLSHIACVITHKGDAAGRSGLGAVLGSKRLKAVVVNGDKKVPVADVDMANRIRTDQLKAMEETGFIRRFHKYGTSGHGDMSAASGDTPVKNWAGIGVVDLPDVSGLHRDMMIANVKRRFGCWRCPAACKASLNAGTGDFNYPEGIQRVEYETIGAFGALCMNTNAESIQMAGHLCNAYGMDTISAGAIIAFAMECHEKGIITRADTDGIDLKWGDPKSLVRMTEKLVKREGFGDILADGVKLAAERIGKGSEEYAVHIDGQDLGMHDPKLPGPHFAGHASVAMYKMDATPGRHTQSFGPDSFRSHLSNAMGACMIPLDQKEGELAPYAETYMRAITGLDRSYEELLKAGERIANMRHVFNLREGINPLERYVHPRIIGIPPQEEGPLRDVTLDIDEETWWNLGALDWDRVTTRPSKVKLLELGLDDVAEELYPSIQE
ncbi:MAG: aldehyde ferredoxin oxidoreductase family protein [Dehalococcoidales bacterium]|nr:aldehyde ferredoxin oxidoreductase family protein [Dehalococcoidales bacterium]